MVTLYVTFTFLVLVLVFFFFLCFFVFFCVFTEQVIMCAETRSGNDVVILSRVKTPSPEGRAKSLKETIK